MIKINKQLKSVLLSTGILVATYMVANILGADSAHAQTISDAIGRVRENISQTANLIYTGSYIGGTTALMMGAFKLKAHAENPGQTPMQQGLARLAVGGALVALPTVGQTIVTSTAGTATNLTSQQGHINVQ